jgi:murein DD-endopeptidase MepM/ murein hydrolase activator NlpD
MSCSGADPRIGVESLGDMRPWLLAPVAALLIWPAAALAQSEAPDEAQLAAPPSGGVEFGVDPRPARPAPTRPLRVSDFEVSPSTVVSGAVTTVRVRLTGGDRKARVRVVLVPSDGRRARATLDLGWRATGATVTRRWRLRRVRAGTYVARVHAVDPDGRTLKRTAAASGKLPITVEVAPAPAPAPAPTATPAPVPSPASIPATGGPVFPVRGGPWSFGGPDAGFGAQRTGHIHEGQDITAPEGTPLASPLAGVVFWRSVQDAGAGHYLVIRAVDGRDYVFMHLVAGSETVAKGDPVARGQLIGQVGSTGDASGPHLHFELWPHGWYGKGSSPIDPLPELKAWAAANG